MPVQSGLKKSVPIETGVLVEGGKEVVCQQLVSALNPGRVGRRAFLSFAAFQLDFAAQARARRGHHLGGVQEIAIEQRRRLCLSGSLLFTSH
jgi:hypothetical protein